MDTKIFLIVASDASDSGRLLSGYNFKIKAAGNLIDALLDYYFIGDESEQSYVEENRYKDTLMND